MSDVADEAEVERKTAIQAYQYRRDIIMQFATPDSPLMLG